MQPLLNPTWLHLGGPRSSKIEAEVFKKSMLKNTTIPASILTKFGRRFGRVFGRFFQRKFVEKCKNALLAKTLKIAIFPREN